MIITGVNNYSVYTSYNTTMKKQNVNKEYNNTREYKQYLNEKYCLCSKDYSVTINSSLLTNAMADEKTRGWLEENLALIPKAVEKAKVDSAAWGGRLISYEISIDGYDSISSKACGVFEADPGTEHVREELENRLEKKREERKFDEKNHKDEMLERLKEREELIFNSESVDLNSEIIQRFDWKI